MQDVLLAATQSADAIIQERLNGLNFGKQYVAQRDLLKSLSSKNSLLGAIGKDMREVPRCVLIHCRMFVVKLESFPRSRIFLSI